MASRLNSVYADGLTRFETRGRSTSAIEQPSKIDSLMGKYSPRKDGVFPPKGMDFDIPSRKLGADPMERVNRAERQAMGRSMDKFLHKGNSAYEERKFGGVDYMNDLGGASGKGRIDNFNPHIPDYRRSQMYDRPGKFEGLTRFDRPEMATDPYSKYSEVTRSSQDIDLLRKELQLKGGITNDYKPKEKLYYEQLNAARNHRALDARLGTGKQTEYNPQSLLKQLNEDPRRQAALMGRQFGREPNRQFGKELNRDYMKELGRGYDCGQAKGYDLGQANGYNVGKGKEYDLGQGKGYDFAHNKAYDLGQAKDLFSKELGRDHGGSGLNKDYLKDYSALLGRQAGLARMKASGIGKSIGKDYRKDYARELDIGKSTRYDNPRGNNYGQNLYQGQLPSKRDPYVGYRGSFRGNY